MCRDVDKLLERMTLVGIVHVMGVSALAAILCELVICGGSTLNIGRFNTVLGQRRSRLLRKPPFPSKKANNYFGAIWCFIHNYSRYLQAVLSLTTNYLCMTTR